MNPYISLYKENKTRKFKRFTEASFSSEKIERILTLFNKVLSKRVRQTITGNPSAYLDYQNKEGRFHCFNYFYGRGMSIVYKISFSNSATFHSIDFYFKPYALEDGLKPSLRLDNIEGLNIVQLINTVSEIVITKKSVEDVVFVESKYRNGIKVLQENSGLKDLSFANNIRSMVGDFLLSLQGKDLKFAIETINKDDGKMYQQLHALYNAYRKKNKEKPDKYYTNFRATIKKQLVMSGERKGKIVSAKPPKVTKQKYLPRLINDNEQAKAYRDSVKGSVAERFEQVEDDAKRVIQGKKYGFVLCGDPGIGKTWTIEQVLKDSGYTEYEGDDSIKWEEDEETGEQVALMPEMPEKEFFLLKGSVTPAALYSYMYMFNNRMMLVDDTDSALKKDPNLIKAAIDTKPRRKITRSTKGAILNKSTNDPFPPSFLYTGRIIFITNLQVEDLDSAIFSRGGVVELVLSADEIVERARGLKPKYLKELKLTSKDFDDVLKEILFANENFGIEKIDLRVLETCLGHKEAKDWKNRIGRTASALSKITKRTT
jgi:hypothetical protein